jgi:hypothetical protein
VERPRRNQVAAVEDPGGHHVAVLHALLHRLPPGLCPA